MYQTTQMKKLLSPQFIILFFAMLVAFAVTIYVGNFTANTSKFYWNTLLINITFMGDAFFAFGVSIFLLFYFKRKKIALNLIVTILFTLVFVQVIKNMFSSQSIQLFFETGIMKDDADNLFYTNFISSHTAIVFTLAIFFAKQSKNIYVIIVLFALAILVAYSRVILVEESLLALSLGLLPAASASFLINKLNVKKESNRSYFYKSTGNSSLNNTNRLLQV